MKNPKFGWNCEQLASENSPYYHYLIICKEAPLNYVCMILCIYIGSGSVVIICIAKLYRE